jgi:hypothetical protein
MEDIKTIKNFKDLKPNFYKLTEEKQILPATLFKIDQYFKDPQKEKERIVGQYNIKIFYANFLVSTVFLALDHNYRDKGEPVLFETCIFVTKIDDPEQSVSEIVERYRTWPEAERGHNKWIKEVKSWKEKKVIKLYGVKLKKATWRRKLEHIIFEK